MEKATTFVPEIVDGKVADEAGKIFDLTQSVPEASIAFVTLSIIAAVTVIVLLLIRFMNKNGGHFLPFILGLVSYMFFGYVIYGMLATLLNMIPGMTQFSLDYPVQRLIMVMLLSAFLCVFGRFFSLKLLASRYDEPGDMLTFSTGFALGNAGSNLIYWLMTMTVMMTINQSGGLIGVFTDYSAEEMLVVAKNYEALFTTPKESWMYQGLFVVIMIAFNVYSTILLYGVSKKQLPVYWTFIVTAVNFALTFVNGLAGYEYIPYMAAFIIEMLIIMVSLRYIFYVSKTELGDVLRTVNKPVNGKRKPSMMKNKNKGHQNFPKFK